MNGLYSPSLLRTTWRYLSRHPWQTFLMIIGITLGVAVVVAIDLANASASQAFALSTEAVTGKATHQIRGGPQGLDETVYTRLRRLGLTRALAPVISEYTYSESLGGAPLQLLGVDPFAETPFRDYLGGGGGESGRTPVEGLTDLLTIPGGVLISANTASLYGYTQCASPPAISTPACELPLEIAGRQRTARIVGIIRPSDSLSSRALDNLLLTDIASAQELTGRFGRLDRIDLILPGDPAQRQALSDSIQSLLPAGARLEPVEARGGAVEQMTSAFNVNLTALSLLALVVGLFLIYNTITFSVVQRRPFFGTLRCLGVTRLEIFALVLTEAVIVGVLGSFFGLLLGILLGQGAVRLVTQTINDLFFVVTVRGVQIPIESLVKGALLGVGATLLTAAPPAWEAATVAPRLALSRSGLEGKARLAVRLAGAAGLGVLALGVTLLALPANNLVVSFTGTFAVIVGFAMLAPLTTLLLVRLSSRPLGRLWGTLGRMAARDVANSLSRTSIAIAALMVAVSVTIGVSVMVSSFRHTVIAWLDQTLQGDIYISAPTLTSTTTSAPVEPEIIAALQARPEVEQVLVLRSVTVDSPAGPVHIAASSNQDVAAERLFQSTSLPAEQVPAAMLAGGVLVSEPFANRYGVRLDGPGITLSTDNGDRTFPVIGIYYDYSSTQGTVMMLLDTYRQYWDDPEVTAVALHVRPGVPLDGLVSALRADLNPLQRLVIRANQALRQEVLTVFDRTFAITSALQLLATIVAFIGILSALLSLELERQRELGILRAVGLTVRQLWQLIFLQTGLMGSVAGVLAMPTGFVLSLILVYIINRRSFGWTLQMQVLPEPFIQAYLVAVVAALLAGIYPVYRMSRISEADAMRYE